jgi:hypothetical protein
MLLAFNMSAAQPAPEVKGVPMSDLSNENVVICGVEFGVPSRDGMCVQVGICRITPEAQAPQAAPTMSEKRRCQRATAHAEVTSDGRLRLFFPRAGMLPCTERAIFKNAWFPVPQAYALPGSLMGAFEHHPQPVVPVGKYRIENTANGYSIVF